MRISDWSSDVCSSDLRCALRHPQCVRALILIDTQAQTEDAAKTEGYKQMLEAWAQHGLPQQIADTVAQIILGPGWSGTPAWQDKWRGWQAHNLRSEEHTSELQSLMRISYAVFCLKKKKKETKQKTQTDQTH